MSSGTSDRLVKSAKALRTATRNLNFAAPVAYVYNPLVYAWAPHEAYLRKFAGTPKRVIFLGMNPGPFGMVQTGVPFGEISAVRDWLQVEGPVSKPPREHPRRPVTGFSCKRSEVSGRRLWGLFAARFGRPESFFAEHLVMNYCPLAFLEATGRNRTPDKLPSKERDSLFAACDDHLRSVVEALQPTWLIGIGDFAWRRVHAVFPKGQLVLGRILHPSPASPAANRNWSGLVTRQLEQLGVWNGAGTRARSATGFPRQVSGEPPSLAKRIGAVSLLVRMTTVGDVPSPGGEGRVRRNTPPELPPH
jgi:single-strand selective monofunctional uracil DNA glycosylase